MEEKEDRRTLDYDVSISLRKGSVFSYRPKEKAREAEASQQSSLAGKWRKLRYAWQSEGFYAMFDELAKMKEEK